MRDVGALKRWAKRLAPKAIILLYHRVAKVDADPQLLCVTPLHFTEHLEVLRHIYHPLSLRSLRHRLGLNLWRPGSVAITFDDGYADNLHQARPLLERFNVPATVFVVAGQVGTAKEFWWDELTRILLATPAVDDLLTLTIAGRPYSWRLNPNPPRSFGTSRSVPAQGWHILMENDPSPRHTAYRELFILLRGLDNQTRENALTDLSAWAGMDRAGRPEYGILDLAGLRSLAQGGLVEVGAHTLTHDVLSVLPAKAQKTEILASKCRLEEILGQPVASFSYPFGGRGDYTAETVRFVREAGFSIACANFPGQVLWGTDLYQLPRFLVRDWDGNEFEQRLANWFHG